MNLPPKSEATVAEIAAALHVAGWFPSEPPTSEDQLGTLDNDELPEHDSPVIAERVLRLVPTTQPDVVGPAQARLPGAGQPGIRKCRGFAAMSKAKRSVISSKGGKAAHALGKAHVFTSEEAKAAGRKGGSANRRTGQRTLPTG